MSELGRIGDHAISVGLQAMDLGAFSIMLWTFVEREKLYDIFEAATGARLTTSWTRIGGMENKKVLRSMELMSGRVMPGVRKLTEPMAA